MDTEKDLGFKGLIKLNDMNANCREGDRVLIHNGVYELNNSFGRSVKVIGLGNNVIFKYVEPDHGDAYFMIGIEPTISISFENIIMYGNAKEHDRSHIDCICLRGGNMKLTITNCVFRQILSNAVCLMSALISKNIRSILMLTTVYSNVVDKLRMVENGMTQYIIR